MTFIDDYLTEEAKKDSIPEKSPPEGKQWGYDLYPERRKPDTTPNVSGLLDKKGYENIQKIKCERNVYKCIKQSPIIKLMMGALKSSGCPVDIRRHISCEECDPSVSGGFDPVLNQVVVCQNGAKKPAHVQGVLLHEMIHMFDYCRHDLNFRNLDHLACTEIRAANLAHCSFMSAWVQGDASLFNIKATHGDCVKSKALSSILATRNVSTEEAVDAIERVFPKCYRDLEPVGRRIRRNSDDMYKAYTEGFYYGYDSV
ncbi:Mitochondrial inner membrane protease ATP23 homolog-like Protein [Tribolium castaneum]|uniref:Mitochondrial inner membrane protease ATP23 n=1 Tax=Tribolium castaneum TaxID=7070 RepID=D6WG43_TRICA|nr:PREDICTED: mitochondrial inner membrane protease ATP23 homolog [Tribolium castaneum]EFA00208.1 Mitochondrial inner membrane protease ATP23 homolog-like Protein [Tribolium castaneum]|eukprot:XP_971269.1 PREDICTED: mitochondrial inner membrane protease ATP23 homolog [Tribolium castaneum]